MKAAHMYIINIVYMCPFQETLCAAAREVTKAREARPLHCRQLMMSNYIFVGNGVIRSPQCQQENTLAISEDFALTYIYILYTFRLRLPWIAHMFVCMTCIRARVCGSE